MQVVAFDKTGTLTIGHPVLTGGVASSGRRLSNRPTSRRVGRGAIRASAGPRGRQWSGSRERRARSLSNPGSGRRERHPRGVGHRPALIGRRALLAESGISVPEDLVAIAEERERQGQTTIYVADHEKALGVIAAADTLRPTAREAVARLRQLGIGDLIMLLPARSNGCSVCRRPAWHQLSGRAAAGGQASNG